MIYNLEFLSPLLFNRKSLFPSFSSLKKYSFLLFTAEDVLIGDSPLVKKMSILSALLVY